MTIRKITNQNIALVGYAGSGKTSIAKMFAERQGYQIFSLGTRVREFVATYLGIEVEDLNKKQHRELLQSVGQLFKKPLNKLDEYERFIAKQTFQGLDLEDYIQTEIFTDEFWINELENTIPFDMESMDNNAIVDDVRFLVEAKTLIKYGFKIVRIMPPKTTVAKRMAVRDDISYNKAIKVLDDITEQSWFDIPVHLTAYIDEFDTLEDLYNLITEGLSEWDDKNE